jgi:hypothetical protein
MGGCKAASLGYYNDRYERLEERSGEPKVTVQGE